MATGYTPLPIDIPDVYKDAAIKEAMDYINSFQSGNLGGVPTASHLNWLTKYAADQQRAYGGEYDDSWLRPLLGGSSLPAQQQQLDYAAQRAQHTGDTSWFPQAPTAPQTIPQQEYALEWARKMGQHNPSLVNESALQQMLGGGASPTARQMQMQYAIDLFNRTGDWRPELVNTTPYGGTPTASQYLQNFYWQNLQDEMQHRSLDPQSGAYRRDIGFLQNLASMLKSGADRGGYRFEPTTPNPLGAATRALDSFLGSKRTVGGDESYGPASPTQPEVARLEDIARLGTNEQTKISLAQRLAPAYTYAEFISWIRRDPTLTDTMRNQLTQWANSKRFDATTWRQG